MNSQLNFVIVIILILIATKLFFRKENFNNCSQYNNDYNQCYNNNLHKYHNNELVLNKNDLVQQIKLYHSMNEYLALASRRENVMILMRLSNKLIQSYPSNRQFIDSVIDKIDEILDHNSYSTKHLILAYKYKINLNNMN